MLLMLLLALRLAAVADGIDCDGAALQMGGLHANIKLRAAQIGGPRCIASLQLLVCVAGGYINCWL